MQKHIDDPDGLRLPIKIDTTSNGEFVPVPLSRANRQGNRLALETALPGGAMQEAARLGLGLGLLLGPALVLLSRKFTPHTTNGGKQRRQ